MAKATFHFPKNFLWGTAPAAHQVEGRNTNNDWGRWEQEAERIRDGSTSAVACNWWEDAEADLDRMAEMGQNAPRLSLEWSRVEPHDGQWDEVAIERYRALLTGLRYRSIQPMVTLHHFSNPQWFVDQGGWENRELALSRFPRYVGKVVGTLGDLTDLWCTFNEPNNYILMGWLWGRWPPGQSDSGRAMRVMSHILQSHAAAYHTIQGLYHKRQEGRKVDLRGWPRAPDRLSATRRIGDGDTDNLEEMSRSVIGYLGLVKISSYL